MYDVGIMGNGALAGLVAITSGTSTIEPWGAIVVGLVAGALYILGSKCSVWFKVRPVLPFLQYISLAQDLICSLALLQCHRTQSSEPVMTVTMHASYSACSVLDKGDSATI